MYNHMHTNMIKNGSKNLATYRSFTFLLILSLSMVSQNCKRKLKKKQDGKEMVDSKEKSMR